MQGSIPRVEPLSPYWLSVHKYAQTGFSQARWWGLTASLPVGIQNMLSVLTACVILNHKREDKGHRVFQDMAPGESSADAAQAQCSEYAHGCRGGAPSPCAPAGPQDQLDNPYPLPCLFQSCRRSTSLTGRVERGEQRATYSS